MWTGGVVANRAPDVDIKGLLRAGSRCLTLMMGARASWASLSNCAASLLYCSMYIRMVAPAEPVPERRKMMREPSVGGRQRCEHQV